MPPVGCWRRHLTTRRCGSGPCPTASSQRSSASRSARATPAKFMRQLCRRTDAGSPPAAGVTRLAKVTWSSWIYLTVQSGGSGSAPALTTSRIPSMGGASRSGSAGITACGCSTARRARNCWRIATMAIKSMASPFRPTARSSRRVGTVNCAAMDPISNGPPRSPRPTERLPMALRSTHRATESRSAT